MDDEAAAAVLIRLLRADGHDVWLPQENGVAGLVDPRHFARAITDSRVVITFNYDDFKDLHLLIHAAAGRHAGLLVVRKDNDSTRDLSAR